MIGRLRHAANVAYTRARDGWRRVRMRRDRALWWVATRRPLWRAQPAVERPNTFFSRSRLRAVAGYVQRAGHAEPALRPRLADSRLRGIRRWEYGVLLALLADRGEAARWKALDVGAGASAFPGYLVRAGFLAGVSTLDLPAAYEGDEPPPEVPGVERVHGSMLEMPFADAGFDLVTCISAIEHLDGDRLAAKHGRAGGERLPYEEYLAATRTALAEMTRVLRPGGFLYLTSDVYFADRQETDTWSSPHGRWPIWSVYRIEDLGSVFLAPLLDAGLELVGGHDYDPGLLLSDPDRATYRGRYFTTFAIWARRPPAPAP